MLGMIEKILGIINGIISLLSKLLNPQRDAPPTGTTQEKDVTTENGGRKTETGIQITIKVLLCVVICIAVYSNWGKIRPESPSVIGIIGNDNTIINGNSSTNIENNITNIINPTVQPRPSASVPTVPPTYTTAQTTTPATSKYPNPPSDELIDIYGPGLHYPDKTEYLDECRTMYVAAPKGYSIYAYSSHRKDKKQIYEVRDGEEVTVLAVNKNNGFSCVIIESTQKAAWVNSAYLVQNAD